MFDYITGKAVSFASSISADQAILALEPLILFVIGMIVYAIFVFRFYRFIGSKNVFKPIDKDARKLKKALHLIDYVFFYPVIAFFWFLVMSILLSILAQTVDIGNIFTASMSTIITIRVLSYYNEELSREVAKLVPLALLGLMLLDITKITINAPLTVLYQLAPAANTLFYYFVFLVAIEFIFRLVSFVKRK